MAAPLFSTIAQAFCAGVLIFGSRFRLGEAVRLCTLRAKVSTEARQAHLSSFPVLCLSLRIFGHAGVLILGGRHR
eukprot:430392-Pleurochrysis_carterae.AAC.7